MKMPLLPKPLDFLLAVIFLYVSSNCLRCSWKNVLTSEICGVRWVLSGAAYLGEHRVPVLLGYVDALSVVVDFHDAYGL